MAGLPQQAPGRLRAPAEADAAKQHLAVYSDRLLVRGQCPLLAQSGRESFVTAMSAIGPKADVARGRSERFSLRRPHRHYAVI
jgi:hypothetical protein